MKRIVCFHSDVDFGVMTHLDAGQQQPPNQQSRDGEVQEVWCSVHAAVNEVTKRTVHTREDLT